MYMVLQYMYMILHLRWYCNTCRWYCMYDVSRDDHVRTSSSRTSELMRPLIKVNPQRSSTAPNTNSNTCTNIQIQTHTNKYAKTNPRILRYCFWERFIFFIKIWVGSFKLIHYVQSILVRKILSVFMWKVFNTFNVCLEATVCGCDVGRQFSVAMSFIYCCL